MSLKYSINSIILNNFRNHKENTFFFNQDCTINAIIGKNGSGKTSLLEAISLLYPGKGIRNAHAATIINKNTSNQYWKIAAKINQSKIYDNEIVIKYDNNKKQILLNDKKINRQTTLAEYIQIIWLSPQISYKIISSMSSRRQFFDRITYLFHKNHIDNTLRYEKAMRERNKLLHSNSEQWISAIERELSKYAVEIMFNRLNAVEKINEMFSKEEKFLSTKIQILDKINILPNNYCDSEMIVLDALKKNRRQDAKLMRTTIGPHCSTINIMNNNKPIELLSSGEQKLTLAIIVLIQTITKQHTHNTTPILLLDDITTQLDKENINMLLHRLKEIKCQTIITDTTKNQNYENIILLN